MKSQPKLVNPQIKKAATGIKSLDAITEGGLRPAARL